MGEFSYLQSSNVTPKPFQGKHLQCRSHFVIQKGQFFKSLVLTLYKVTMI